MHFGFDSVQTCSWWKEGLKLFSQYILHPQVESGRSGVKVELWNMIRLCQNLQLQIVWNWLEVLVLFGRHSAIGSIYLLKTTKVSGNAERGNQIVILLLHTFFPPCILNSLFSKSLCWRESYLERLKGFPCFIFSSVMTMDRATPPRRQNANLLALSRSPLQPKHKWKWVWLLFLMRTTLQRLATMASQIFRSYFAQSLGLTNRSELGIIEIFFMLWMLMWNTVGNEKVSLSCTSYAYTHTWV